MSPDHWLMFLLDVATGLYLAWSMGRIRAQMHQDAQATQTFLRDALQPIQESNERIAQMLRELHQRRP